MFGIAKNLVLQAVASVDRAVTLAVRVGIPGADDAPLDWGTEARLAFLEALVERYDSLDLSDYFAEPSAIEPVLRERGLASKRLQRIDVSWPSAYVPFLPEMRESYLRAPENEWAVARLFRGEARRPVAILVHGYLMGRLSIDERVWPIAHLDATGLDSALVVLPFHGQRADRTRSGRPEFPGRDPRIANEGFRQIVGEIRQLAAWLRREGHPAVGVIGMSLGGYTAALAATIEAKLDFVVPIIPLASLADFAFEHGGLSESPELRAREHALLERAYAVASPLARAPRVPSSRVLVLGGRADRITPLSHAKRLARHFGVPLTTWRGGHLLQLGRSDAWALIAELLRGTLAR